MFNIANLLTSMNLICGMMSIIFCFSGRLDFAGPAYRGPASGCALLDERDFEYRILPIKDLGTRGVVAERVQHGGYVLSFLALVELKYS